VRVYQDCCHYLPTVWQDNALCRHLFLEGAYETIECSVVVSTHMHDCVTFYDNL